MTEPTDIDENLATHRAGDFCGKVVPGRAGPSGGGLAGSEALAAEPAGKTCRPTSRNG